jgi:hypothetical protein
MSLPVVMAALAFMVPGLARETLTFAANRMDAYAARQERLAMKERTTVVSYTGREAHLRPTDLAKKEEGIAGERSRTRRLISDNIEMPLLKFVVAEAEGAMPALLSMAPEHGTITINGTPVSAETAKGGAKAMRKLAKVKRDNGGWSTEVIRVRKT